MTTYVLDANAIVRFLAKTAGYEKVQALLSRAAQGEIELVVSVINRGEALYSLARTQGFEQILGKLNLLGRAVESIPVTEEQSVEAARIHLLYKLGLGDSYAASLAMRLNATLVTADPEFARLGKKLKVLTLPHHTI